MTKGDKYADRRDRARLAAVLGFVAFSVAPLRAARALPLEPPAAAAPESTASPEPEFRAGIPGLKMADVRDHKQLWRDLDEIQAREGGDKISVAEFRRASIEATARFLQLEGSVAERFTSGAQAEVARLRSAFLKSRQTDASTASGPDSFSADLAASAARLSALLGDAPRQRLFVEDEKKWLLRLAFSPKEDKEVREAREDPGTASRTND